MLQAYTARMKAIILVRFLLAQTRSGPRLASLSQTDQAERGALRVRFLLLFGKQAAIEEPSKYAANQRRHPEEP